jgi:hypothetical protein
MRPGLFGVVLICPADIKETFVFDTRQGRGEVIYRDAVIPTKAMREKIRNESILVSDAVRLAKAAIAGDR